MASSPKKAKFGKKTVEGVGAKLWPHAWGIALTSS
jgi:hypothetical protein